MTVSIIIPVFNVAPYLRACLDSVIAAVEAMGKNDEGVQGNDRLFAEIICVDDGSSDGSEAILDEYAAQDSRFKVLHQKNAGVSAARNSALEIAKGDWVMFVDADDVVACDAFDKAAEASSSDVELISFNSVTFADGAQPQFDTGSHHQWWHLSWQEYLGCYRASRNLWQAWYRRNLIGDKRFVSGMVMGEDREFQARLLAEMNKVAVSDAPLYGYRIRASSAMNTEISAKKFVDRLTASHLCRQHLAAAGRFDPSRDARFRAMNATEFASADYFALSPLDRKLVKPVWDKTLRYVREDVYAPRWCRFAAAVSLMAPWDWVRYLLFRVPLWLKRKGVHR